MQRGGGGELETGGWRREGHRVGFPEGCRNREVTGWERVVVRAAGGEKREGPRAGEDAQVGGGGSRAAGLGGPGRGADGALGRPRIAPRGERADGHRFLVFFFFFLTASVVLAGTGSFQMLSNGLEGQRGRALRAGGHPGEQL